MLHFQLELSLSGRTVKRTRSVLSSSICAASFACICLMCVCPLLVHLVWAVSRKVLAALLSPLKHVRCLCMSLWHRTGGEIEKSHGESTRSQKATSSLRLGTYIWPPGACLDLIVVSCFKKKNCCSLQKLHGFSFNAGSVFVVVSYCFWGEWRVAASGQ